MRLLDWKNKMDKITPHNPDWYPPCFENKEHHQDYMFQVQRTNQPFDPLNYCLDCTREYKIQMLKEKRCEHPETIFVVWRSSHKKHKVGVFTEEPDILGISNNSKFWDTPAYDNVPGKPKELPPCL